MALKSSTTSIIEFEGGSIAYMESDETCWEAVDADLLHVSVPAGKLRVDMEALGFRLADRTLYVSVPVKPGADFSGGIRTVPVSAEKADDACFRIAREGFAFDARFHVSDDDALADSILRAWLEGCRGLMTCEARGEIAGFLDLAEAGDNTLFVRLAATDPRFRLAGTALSLYSRAAQIAQERGMRLLDGRISSKNIAVMNLYAHLGGRFSDPRDVYVKDMRNETR